MMNGMSFSETIFLFFLALIIFGPKKLPEIARQVGRYLNEFKRASNEFKAQIEQEIAHLEHENAQQQILPPSTQPEGTASRSTYAASELTQHEPKALEAATEASPEMLPAADANENSSTSESAPPAEPVATSTSQESHA